MIALVHDAASDHDSRHLSWKCGIAHTDLGALLGPSAASGSRMRVNAFE